MLNWCDEKRDVAACRVLNGRAIAEEDTTVTQRRKTDSQRIRPSTPNSGSSIALTELAKRPMRTKQRNCNAAFSGSYAPSRRIHSVSGTGQKVRSWPFGPLVPTYLRCVIRLL